MKDNSRNNPQRNKSQRRYQIQEQNNKIPLLNRQVSVRRKSKKDSKIMKDVYAKKSTKQKECKQPNPLERKNSKITRPTNQASNLHRRLLALFFHFFTN